jgi:Uncharacterized protein conserved in bacteria
MNQELIKYGPIAEAIAVLFHPHAEVVIHDLKTGTISAIYNNMSKRKEGDESLIEEIHNERAFPNVFPLYFKRNWDGRKMKCVSTTLRNQKGKPIGLLCINVDLSEWQQMEKVIQGWLGGVMHQEPIDILFKNDWKEKINVYVSDYLKKEGLILNTMSKDEKKKLIQMLHQEGAFEAKNAAAYVAEVLGVSRASVYNYLRTK